MKRFLCIVLAFASVLSAAGAKPVTFTSPDGRLTATIESGPRLTWSLQRDGEILIQPSEIGITLLDGTVWGAGTRFRAPKKRSVSEEIDAILFKRSRVEDRYNEVTLRAKGFSVVFRLYDDGFAYRFVPEKAVTVKSESASFSFARDWNAYIPYVSQHLETLESQFMSSFESQ
ncbi:MAG: glycoside hydrolase family 97 N-terminal domain-containing protein, partial [Bacteroidales bacterium]|nr:glycoside hydrolase family 97 N-terminal domain-containing protein [Bacteroidales bacterium]